MAIIGIIGTGWGARVQTPAFRREGHEVRAIAGSRIEKTRAAALKLGVDAVGSWREIIDDASIELVSIVTPPAFHAEMAIAALRAGKHVLCEKPTALNAIEARQMLTESQSHSGQIAIIDHELRFLPTWIEAKRRVAELGAIRSVDIRYSSPGRGDRSREWNWWSDTSQGGGIWGAVGSHMIDSIRYLGQEISAARAILRTTIEERPLEGVMKRVTSDDFALVELRLTSGAVAMLTLSAVATVDEPTTITVEGEEGAIRLVSNQLLVARRGDEWNEALRLDESPSTGDSAGGWFGTGTIYLARALRAALEGNDPSVLSPAASFADGLEQQCVLDAARDSHTDGGGWEPIAKKSAEY